MKALHDSFWKCQILCIVTLLMGLSVSVALGANQYPDRTVSGPTENFPAQFSAFTPPVDPSMSIHSNAPQISEWTRMNQPGDTMVLTGEDLSSYTGDAEGRDTRFVFYGNGSAGVDGLVQRLDGQQCAITLPDNLPQNEMYLMWPRNSNGFGKPVTINKTELWWVGASELSRGAEFYIYGRNLKLGAGECSLYIKELDRWLTSANANQYKAMFTLPVDIPYGTYTLYAHNGHGEKYGWSDPKTLVVHWEMSFTTNVFNVSDYGANGSDEEPDDVGINAAIAASTYGSTIYFPTGDYYLTNALFLIKERKYEGDGMGLTTFEVIPGGAFKPAHAIGGGAVNDIEVRGFTVTLNANTVNERPFEVGYGKRVVLENVEVNNYNTPSHISTMSINNARNLLVKGCRFGVASAGIYFGGCKWARFEDCEFVGGNDIGQMNSFKGTSCVDMSNCYVEDLDHRDMSSGAGWSKGRWVAGLGSIMDCYWGGNTTHDIVPRQAKSFLTNVPVKRVGEWNKDAMKLFFENIPDEFHGRGKGEPVYRGVELAVRYVPSREDYYPEKSWHVNDIDAVEDSVTISVPGWASHFLNNDVALEVDFLDLVDRNSGEQILFEGTGTRFRGYPTSVTPTNLIFGNNTTAQLDSAGGSTIVHIVKGRGMGQSRRVSLVDSLRKQITIDKPWNVLPDNTSLIHYGNYLNRLALYDNYFDGRPDGTDPSLHTASAGFQPSGGSSEIIIDSNTFNELRKGVSFYCEGINDRDVNSDTMPQTYFNHIIGNQFNNCMMDTYIATSIGDPARPLDETDAAVLGNVYRGNTSIGAVSCFASITSETSDETLLQMNVFQGNDISGVPNAIIENHGVKNQVWIENVLSGLASGAGYTIAKNHVPVLRGNTWSSFPSIYEGYLPGARLEVPRRVSELRSDGTTVSIPVWNSGTDSMNWTVKPLTDAPWLDVRLSNTSVLNSTATGLITLAVLQPLPSVDAEAVLLVSDGNHSQQVTVLYSAESASISVSRTTYTVPSGTFWVEVVDQETQARRDLGLWYGPCDIPIENMPAAATVIIKKKNETTTAWELYEEIGKGNRPGV